MRTARIKVDGTDTWYHCYNRTAGTSRDRPFRDAEKEQFVRILRRVSLLYGIRIVAYQVMSNHYHLLVHAPKEVMPVEEVCRRYRAFHRGKKILEPDSDRCRKWQQRTRDISWFMRHLQQLFTCWYNRSRVIRRRGSLWADRFKHTILEASAAWACWRYIEHNPVRAGMVRQAGSYRFCSYGYWCQTGQHPFPEDVASLLPVLGVGSMGEALGLLTAHLEEHPGGILGEIGHRVRYWVDGLVIGSELFVRGVMADHHPYPATRRIMTQPDASPPLACWRRLRGV